MKAARLLVILVVATLLSSSAYCGTNDWGWAFGVSSSVSSCAGVFGVDPLASNNYDALDLLTPTYKKAFFGTYHINGEDSWTGDTGFYSADVRAPLYPVAGNSTSWLIYVWGGTNVPDTANWLSIDCTYSSRPPADLDCWLTLKAKPESITDGPAAGTSWHVSDTLGGYTRLPMYRTDNGLTGYQFELTATVIPEPASLLALTSGLMGLGCFVRKKR